MGLHFSVRVRFASRVSREARLGYQWSRQEVDDLEEYLNRVGATKYAPDPADNSRVVFIADVEKASSAEYPPPGFLAVFSCDFLYMPLAYRGDFGFWEQRMKWFLDLPQETRQLPVSPRRDGGETL